MFRKTKNEKQKTPREIKINKCSVTKNKLIQFKKKITKIFLTFYEK